MEILRHIVLLIHLTGFAILFGAWIVEVVNRRRQFTALMEWGLAIAGLAGIILAAPFGRDYDLNPIKLIVKFGILLIIGALLGIGRSRLKKTGSVPPAMFWSVGILTFANATIAVLWR